MNFTTLQIGIEKNVARIALNRPDARNTMNTTMIYELTEAIEWLDSRDDIRIIEICGNGKSFCAGADLHYMKEIAENNYSENFDDAQKLSKLFQTIYFCNKAVITVVHGAVIGGGNGIMAASDIVIADKDTIFAFSEVKLGLTPATISPFVVARCGETAARELMLTGRKFTADEALQYRLVNYVGNQDEVNQRLEYYIQNFLEASPYAVKECKLLLRAVCRRDNQNDDIFNQTAAAIAEQRQSEDAREGMNAFFKKRKPKWKEN